MWCLHADCGGRWLAQQAGICWADRPADAHRAHLEHVPWHVELPHQLQVTPWLPLFAWHAKHFCLGAMVLPDHQHVLHKLGLPHTLPDHVMQIVAASAACSSTSHVNTEHVYCSNKRLHQLCGCRAKVFIHLSWARRPMEEPCPVFPMHTAVSRMQQCWQGGSNAYGCSQIAAMLAGRIQCTWLFSDCCNVGRQDPMHVRRSCTQDPMPQHTHPQERYTALTPCSLFTCSHHLPQACSQIAAMVAGRSRGTAPTCAIRQRTRSGCTPSTRH